MLNLLKVDLYRILKSKTTLISLIISIFMAGLFIALVGLGDIFEEDASGIQEVVRSSMFFTVLQIGYQPFGDMGIVLVIFGSIFVMTDINTGALRNKVIHGYKRSQIYFSHLITSILYFLVLISLSAGIIVGGSSLIYQQNFFAGIESYYIWTFFLNGTLTFVLISSLQIFLLLGFKNSPLSIIVPLGLGVIFYLASSLIPTFVDPENLIKYALAAIPTYTMRVPNALLLSSSYSLGEALITIGSTLFFAIVNTVLGLVLFIKRDLK